MNASSGVQVSGDVLGAERIRQGGRQQNASAMCGYELQVQSDYS